MDQFFSTIRRTGFTRGPGRLVGGIAASLAAKYNFDIWVVRLAMLLSFLLPVLGIGAYLVVWAITPWEDGRIPLEEMLGGRRA